MTTLSQISPSCTARASSLSMRTRLLFDVRCCCRVACRRRLPSCTRARHDAGQPLALGLVLTAYLAGIKHSYDWDHIAAIDNSTRKFVAQRQDPVSVGFAFSLGHSSVVILAGVLVVAGATVVGRRHGGRHHRATWCWD